MCPEHVRQLLQDIGKPRHPIPFSARSGRAAFTAISARARAERLGSATVAQKRFRSLLRGQRAALRCVYWKASEGLRSSLQAVEAKARERINEEARGGRYLSETNNRSTNRLVPVRLASAGTFCKENQSRKRTLFSGPRVCRRQYRKTAIQSMALVLEGSPLSRKNLKTSLASELIFPRQLRRRYGRHDGTCRQRRTTSTPDTYAEPRGKVTGPSTVIPSERPPGTTSSGPQRKA